jgi:hypothetical protein
MSRKLGKVVLVASELRLRLLECKLFYFVFCLTFKKYRVLYPRGKVSTTSMGQIGNRCHPIGCTESGRAEAKSDLDETVDTPSGGTFCKISHLFSRSVNIMNTKKRKKEE